MAKKYTFADFVPFYTSAIHEASVLRGVHWLAPSDPQRQAVAAAILQALYRSGLCEDDTLTINRSVRRNTRILRFHAVDALQCEIVHLLDVAYTIGDDE